VLVFSLPYLTIQRAFARSDISSRNSTRGNANRSNPAEEKKGTFYSDSESDSADDNDDDDDDIIANGADARVRAAAAAASQRRSLQLVPPSVGPSASLGYRHVCRAEPFDWSPVVGTVGCDRDVEAMARCGAWSKVKVHKLARSSRRKVRRRMRRRRRKGAYEGSESGDEEEDDEGAGLLSARCDGFGWCFEGSGNSGSAHLVDLASPPVSPSNVSAAVGADESSGSEDDDEQSRNEDLYGASMGRNEAAAAAAAAEVAAAEAAAAGYASGRGGGLWHARENDSGHVYYWNDLTRVSLSLRESGPCRRIE